MVYRPGLSEGVPPAPRPDSTKLQDMHSGTSKGPEKTLSPNPGGFMARKRSNSSHRKAGATLALGLVPEACSLSCCPDEAPGGFPPIAQAGTPRGNDDLQDRIRLGLAGIPLGVAPAAGWMHRLSLIGMTGRFGIGLPAGRTSWALGRVSGGHL